MRALTLSMAVLSLTLLSLAGCSDDRLTEEQVRHVLDEVTRATTQKNVSGIVSNMSADAQIELVVDVGMGPQSVVFNRQQYKNMLRETWAQVSEYSHEQKNVEINVSADGAYARVTSLAIDTIMAAGRRMRIKAEEELTIEMVEGAPKIVKVVSREV